MRVQICELLCKCCKVVCGGHQFHPGVLLSVKRVPVFCYLLWCLFHLLELTKPSCCGLGLNKTSMENNYQVQKLQKTMIMDEANWRRQSKAALILSANWTMLQHWGKMIPTASMNTWKGNQSSSSTTRAIVMYNPSDCWVSSHTEYIEVWTPQISTHDSSPFVRANFLSLYTWFHTSSRNVSLTPGGNWFLNCKQCWKLCMWGKGASNLTSFYTIFEHSKKIHDSNLGFRFSGLGFSQMLMTTNNSTLPISSTCLNNTNDSQIVKLELQQTPKSLMEFTEI